jgi:hypothetical protein
MQSMDVRNVLQDPLNLPLPSSSIRSGSIRFTKTSAAARKLSRIVLNYLFDKPNSLLNSITNRLKKLTEHQIDDPPEDWPYLAFLCLKTLAKRGLVCEIWRDRWHARLAPDYMGSYYCARQSMYSYSLTADAWLKIVAARRKRSGI